MLAGANAKHGLHLPPILDRSKADIRASVEDEGPASSERRYNHSNRDQRISRSLNINTSNDNNKRSIPFNSDTAANIRQNSSNYRSCEGLYRTTTTEVTVPCVQTTAKPNRQQMSNDIQRRPLPIKPLSNMTANNQQLTKRNSFSEVPPIGVNRSPRTIDRRPEGQTTMTAPGHRQPTELRPHQQPSAPPPLSHTRELLHNLIAARKPEFLRRHSVNFRDVGGGITVSKDQSQGRCYMRNNKATPQRIEPTLCPGGDFDDDPPLLRGQQTEYRNRMLEGSSTRQKSTTHSGQSSKRGGLGADSGMQQLSSDPRHQTHKQLSDGAILPPPRQAGQSLHHNGNTVYVPTSTDAGSLVRDDDAVADQRESRSPTEFICELARYHKEASDRCLLGPSKEERERHRAKDQLKAASAAVKVDTQLRGKMTNDSSNIQTNCSGIDQNPLSGITGIEPSTPNLVECKTGQEVDGGGQEAETGQPIDITENEPEEEDSATKKTTSKKEFNPLENYGFEWMRWAKEKRRSTAGIGK